MYIKQDTIPQEGQFVAVWMWDGSMCTDAYRWEEDILTMYDVVTDDWLPVPNNKFTLDAKAARTCVYFTLEDV